MTTCKFHARIGGGLGNQLFQLGTTLLLAERLKAQTTICDATGSYDTERSMAFQKLLNISLQFTPGWAALCHRARIGRSSLPFCVNDRTITKLLKAPFDPDSGFGHYFVDGYFQDCWDDSTVKDMVEAVRRRTAAPSNLSDTVAMHIRGGDFLKLPQYQVADHNFYKRAFDLMRQRLQQDHIHLTIVTDDQPYAKSLLEQCKLDTHFSCKFSSNGSQMEDFNTLRTAKARIIANSTFSWWAAALGADQALTIACEYWQKGRRRTYRLANEVLIS